MKKYYTKIVLVICGVTITAFLVVASLFTPLYQLPGVFCSQNLSFGRYAGCGAGIMLFFVPFALAGVSFAVLQLLRRLATFPHPFAMSLLASFMTFGAAFYLLRYDRLSLLLIYITAIISVLSLFFAHWFVHKLNFPAYLKVFIIPFIVALVIILVSTVLLYFNRIVTASLA